MHGRHSGNLMDDSLSDLLDDLPGPGDVLDVLGDQSDLGELLDTLDDGSLDELLDDLDG